MYKYLQQMLTDIKSTLEAVDSSQIERTIGLIDLVKDKAQIFCLGTGQSKLFLSTFCKRLRYYGLNAWMIGDLQCPPAKHGDILVISSCSGTNTSSIEFTQKFKEIGGDVCLFTSDETSPLAHLCDILIKIPATPSLESKNGEQIMRGVFEKSLFLSLEAITIDLSLSCNPDEIVANVE